MPEILGIDAVAFATILLVLATLLLAFANFLLINESKRQITMWTRLIMIFRAQNIPIPVITAVNFIQNTLNLVVNNNGNSPTSSLALSISIIPTKKIFYSDKESEEKISSKDIIKILVNGKEVHYHYEMDEKILKKDGKTIIPYDGAKIIKDVSTKSMMLGSKSVVGYSEELMFGFKDDKKSSGFFCNFDDLITLLKINEIDSFLLNLTLLGKDMAEEPLQRNDIAFFIVDINKHTTLEEAYKEKITPHYYTISMDEFSEKGGLIESDFYEQSKSQINTPEYFEKGKI